MDDLKNLYIDNECVTEKARPHIKLLKIVRSDKMLIDKLYIVLDKSFYKEDLPKGEFCLKLVLSKNYMNIRSIFYCNKEYIAEDTECIERFNEKENAILKQPGNVILLGLSASLAQINKLDEVHDDFFSSPIISEVVCRNTTLDHILKYINQEIFREEDINVQDNASDLLQAHKFLQKPIKYYRPGEPIKKLGNGKFTSHVLEELAEIFYSVVSIRDNVLYFKEKNVISKLQTYKGKLQLREEPIITNYPNPPEDLKGMKGVEYKYWEEDPNNEKKTKCIGEAPYLILPKVYERSLAEIYAVSKMQELKEPRIIGITLNTIANFIPGYYLNILQCSKPLNTFQETKVMKELYGAYHVKEIIITGILEEQTEDPNMAGPSNKKVKLEPTLTWSTSMKLALGTKLSQKYT